MTKHKSDRSAHSRRFPDKGGSRIVRDSSTGQFVIGRNAFGRVSAVEGIVPSRRLEADLRRLDGVSHEKRRGVLAAKYGKK
jgi:hypothetical protein